MATGVMKFGGTSVANVERIRNVAQHVKREVDAGNQVAVVVSAMAGTTNQLVGWVRETALLHDAREYDAIVASGENITAGLLPGRGLWRRAPTAKGAVTEQVRRLAIRLRHVGQAIRELSGGNQQKVLLARWLVRGVRLLICEEPTRGVDIGAKSEIYALLRELADAGIPVLVTSRELPELIGLCDRIVVIREGATVAEFAGADASEEAIMAAAIKGGRS